MTALDDASLIARVVASDDRHAFSMWVRRHHAPVRSFLRRLCAGDDALADDLAQEAFLKAYQSLASFAGAGSSVSWVLAIAWRVFLDEKRRVRHAREQVGLPEPSVSAAPPQSEASGPHHRSARTTARDAARDIERAMAVLSEEQRAALTLCYQWGLTHEEAADVMACPVGTVKSHVLRGKERLRRELAAYAPAASPSASTTRSAHAAP